MTLRQAIPDIGEFARWQCRTIRAACSRLMQHNIRLLWWPNECVKNKLIHWFSRPRDQCALFCKKNKSMWDCWLFLLRVKNTKWLYTGKLKCLPSLTNWLNFDYHIFHLADSNILRILWAIASRIGELILRVFFGGGWALVTIYTIVVVVNCQTGAAIPRYHWRWEPCYQRVWGGQALYGCTDLRVLRLYKDQCWLCQRIRKNASE